MPKACVQQKMKPKSKGGQGMTRAAAMKACYPDSRFDKSRGTKRIHKDLKSKVQGERDWRSIGRESEARSTQLSRRKAKKKGY